MDILAGVVIVLAILVLYVVATKTCLGQTCSEPFSPPPRQGKAPIAFNKRNASWNRFGYNNPTLSQSFRANKQLYNAYETYWQGVDKGLFKPPTDPNVYYALRQTYLA